MKMISYKSAVNLSPYGGSIHLLQYQIIYIIIANYDAGKLLHPREVLRRYPLSISYLHCWIRQSAIELEYGWIITFRTKLLNVTYPEFNQSETISVKGTLDNMPFYSISLTFVRRDDFVISLGGIFPKIARCLWQFFRVLGMLFDNIYITNLCPADQLYDSYLRSNCR